MNNLEVFLKKCRLQHFSKGEIILVQDEIPATGYLIKKGIVKTYNLTSQGEEKPISFDIKGEVFPIAWVFSKVKVTQYFYEAFTDCEVYCIPRSEYILFMRENPGPLFDMFDYFVSRQLNYQMRINALEQSKASSKVLHTVHFLALRFGKEGKKDTVEIPLPLTQQDLANFMGLTRETTSVELKKLQTEGVIDYRNQMYTVRTDKLDDLLDDDYDQGRILTT